MGYAFYLNAILEVKIFLEKKENIIVVIYYMLQFLV